MRNTTDYLAIALFVLSALASVLLGAVTVFGMSLTPKAAAATIAVSLLLFGLLAFLYDAMRAARWNAGHRLR